jgi:glycosyltransferase involved in cell wall biosynthesis
MNKLVSIIITTYNMEKTILRSIKSCLNQTYKNIEVIVVNDCSTDNTELILENLVKLKKIKYFKLNKNFGCAFSKNFGIKKAKGDFICFLDSDDTLPIESVKKRIDFLQSNESYGMVCGSTNYLDNLNNLKFIRKININILNNNNDNNNNNKSFIADQFLNVCSTPFITASVMYRRNVFIRNKKINNLFDINLKRFEDGDFIYKNLLKFKIGYIVEPVYNYYKGSKDRKKRLGDIFLELKGKLYSINKYKKGLYKYYLIITNILQFPLKLIHQLLFF